MNDATFAARPLSSAYLDSATRQPWLPALIALAACLGMLATTLFWRPFFTGDEGFYGVTARNMLLSPSYILQPSYLPAGDFATDRAGFAHPPINSYLYALGFSLARGSFVGPDLLNVLCFAGLLCFAYRLLALADRNAAGFAVLLLAASPAIVGSYSLWEAEPLMTMFGIAALYVCIVGLRASRAALLFTGGLCLGAAFAVKLWLFGPLALAVATELLLNIRRPNVSGRATARAFVLVALGALVVPAFHLGAIAWLQPQDLRFWLHDIYFGLFTQSGISGSKLAGGATPSQWVHPVWYYGAALYRDHFFLVPLFLCGGISLLRDTRFRPLLPALVAGASGLIPLSLMRVKEPLYILSCSVFLYLLAAACLGAVMHRLSTGRQLDRISLFGGTFLSLAFAFGILVAFVLRIRPDEITGGFTIAHSLAYAAILGALWWSSRLCAPRRLWQTMTIASALAIAATLLGASLTRPPRDAMIARLVQPHLADNSPATLSFIASNFKSHQLHTFRRGCYWHELNLAAPPEVVLGSEPMRTVRVFIVEDYDAQRPELAPWLRWLERHTTEKTRELDAALGATAGARLFVRENG